MRYILLLLCVVLFAGCQSQMVSPRNNAAMTNSLENVPQIVFGPRGDIQFLDNKGNKLPLERCDEKCRLLNTKTSVKSVNTLTVITHEGSCCMTFSFKGNMMQWCDLPELYCK